MKSVKGFLRSIPVGLRRDFLERYAAELAASVDWSRSDPDLLNAIHDSLQTGSYEVRQDLQSVVERLGALADAPGDAAIRSVLGDAPELAELPGPDARALSLFLDDATAFRRAEDIRYTDQKRRGKMWDGFVGPEQASVALDGPEVERLRVQLKERFGWPKVHIDAFERSRVAEGSKTYRLFQLTISREGWPVQMREFVGENLEERSLKPAIDAAISYEPETGSVEVVANEKTIRDAVAGLFFSAVLDSEFTEVRLPLRRFDLDVLRNRCDFPSDVEDRIEAVRVPMLRLMPIDTAEERIVLETLSGAEDTIWEMARNRFGANDPLRGGWTVTQARLTIRFHREGGNGERRTLPITITMPHGSDLKDRTERERLIGQKYLVRWGLLQDVAAA